MELQVDFWKFVGMQAALIAALAGLLLKVGHTLLKAFLTQFELRLDTRFNAQDEAAKSFAAHWDTRFEELKRAYHALDRGQSQIKEEMLREYVRREDAIRDQTVTQAKLDALGAKIELLSQLVARMDGLRFDKRGETR